MLLNILKMSLLMLSVSMSWTASSPVSFENDTDSESPFRKDYKYVAETATFYKVHREVRTWSGAVATCKAEGAQLATPLAEKDAQVLTLQVTDNTWLGINDLLAEGNFRTVNEYILAAVVDRCYKLHTNPKNWHEAYNICLGEEAHLAVINSGAEAEVLVNEIEKQPKNALRGDVLLNMKKFFLGFSDVLIPGEFLSINGRSLDKEGYNLWADGEPDILEDEKNCGGMSTDGKLYVVACDVRAFFFCEKKLTENVVSIDARFAEDSEIAD